MCRIVETTCGGSILSLTPVILQVCRNVPCQGRVDHSRIDCGIRLVVGLLLEHVKVEWPSMPLSSDHLALAPSPAFDDSRLPFEAKSLARIRTILTKVE